MKCLYLVTRSLDPTGTGKARWVIRWESALNAFAITFGGRINPSDNQERQRPVTQEICQSRPGPVPREARPAA